MMMISTATDGWSRRRGRGHGRQGKIAGLTVERIINEPAAAAISYESGTQVEEGVVAVQATAGDNQLGGDNIDALLPERLNARLETELGLEHASDASVASETDVLPARLRRAAEGARSIRPPAYACARRRQGSSLRSAPAARG